MVYIGGYILAYICFGELINGIFNKNNYLNFGYKVYNIRSISLYDNYCMYILVLANSTW